MMKIHYIGIVLMAALLAACSNSDGPVGSQSIEWYKAHPEERAKQLAWCNEQSASMQVNSQACTQAKAAGSQASTHGKMPAGY